MRALLDTNVILDIILKREPLQDVSKKVLSLCRKRDIYGFIATTTVSDIFYIAQRNGIDLHPIYLYMQYIFEILKICPVEPADIMEAMDRCEKDFEDCVLAICAERNGFDRIIANNTKDFKSSIVKVVTPEVFLQEYKAQIG